MNFDKILAMIPGSFPFSSSPPSSPVSSETTTTSKATDEQLLIDEYLGNENKVGVSTSLVEKLKTVMDQGKELLAEQTDSMTIPAKAIPMLTYPLHADQITLSAEQVATIFEDALSVIHAFMENLAAKKEASQEALDQYEESDDDLQQGVLIKVADSPPTHDEATDLDMENAIKEAMGELDLDL